MNTGLLILRLVFGLAMAAHGSQKLFGWFKGPGLTGFGSSLESIGFRPGIWFAFVAGYSEVSSGLLLALGLGGPIGPALMISVMIVAVATVHIGDRFFVSTNGVELSCLYLVGALSLLFVGFGQFSLDYFSGTGQNLLASYESSWAWYRSARRNLQSGPAQYGPPGSQVVVIRHGALHQRRLPA